jgi:hypothetical protein
MQISEPSVPQLVLVTSYEAITIIIWFLCNSALSGITSPMSFGDLLGSIVFRLCKGYGASGCRDIAPRVIICQTPMNTGSVSCKAMLVLAWYCYVPFFWLCAFFKKKII